MIAVDKSEIVKSTVAYLERKLSDGAADGLTLDDVAEKIGYSKFYLNRIFQEQVGTTIHQYIMERRLTEAAKELVFTDKPIVDIACEAGYQSQQAFTNAFSNIYLCTPMDYRMSQVWLPLRKPHMAQCIHRFGNYSRFGVAA